jgi:RimJ/RimL family protein N-acetyltransferase
VTADWPLFGLRLRVGELELRPTVDADLPRLAHLHPPDLELDPARPRYGIDSDAERRAWIFQSFWRSVGNWRPESWNLQFSVFADGALVGAQGLEGDEFARRRTIDSWSWLTSSARGRGIGKAMRLAVLALAFDGLDAQFAVTEAWHDNHASLGVSRALGYVDNGWYPHDREPDRVDSMIRMRLTREIWQQRHFAHGVSMENLTPCLAFFGLAS